MFIDKKSYTCNYDSNLNLKQYKFESDNIQMFDCVSSKYSEFFTKYINKDTSSCVYVLINDNEHKIYIGQTWNIVNRINNHKVNKKFNRFIIFNKSDGILSKTYIDYLEWLLIQHFIDKKIFKLNDIEYLLDNSSYRFCEPIIQENEKLIAKNYFEKIIELLGLYGFSFEFKITSKTTITNDETNSFNSEIFYYKKTAIKYNPNTNKVLMLKGSIIPRITFSNNQKSVNYYKVINSKKYFFDSNNNLLDLVNSNEYMLKQDIQISSPSFAAILASGAYSKNGLICYKNKDNKYLKK